MRLRNNIILLLAVSFFIYIVCFLQAVNPCLYEVDGYYHIREPYFIRENGIQDTFRWTQFSTFKDTFSDKEFLFHILILPFTFIGRDIHPQARCAVIFFAMLFTASFIFVQRKYVPAHILPISILALPLSAHFLTYMNYLRPKTLAITILMLFVYFLSEKKWVWVFIISIIYPLAHISYPLAVILAFGIELFRFLHKKEFFARNLLYCMLGTCIGIFIHPNFPNNFISLHLNAFLVPWNTMFGGTRLDYGMEWTPANTQIVIKDFLIPFAGIVSVFIILLSRRPKTSFRTCAFFLAGGLFTLLSMFSTAYWYLAYPFGLLSLSMFFSGWLKDKSRRANIIFLITAGAIFAAKAGMLNANNSIAVAVEENIERNLHYERTAKWMNRHIPQGEIIYHTGWSDSPYFICLNPKDYYINMLDPIYMYYYRKGLYFIDKELSSGRRKLPARTLKKIFRAEYGYTGKVYGLYKQVKEGNQFKILFEDKYGAVFRLNPRPEETDILP